MLALALSAQAAVEIYGAKASQYVPAFIDYTLNSQADVTIQIRPSDAGGTPTGAAVRTVTFTGLARGFHRFIWLAEQDDASTAPMGYYVAELSATSTRAAWGPIIGPFTGVNPTVEGGSDPATTEGFYGTAVNCYPATGQYYGRIYAAHKTNKDIYMYGPDGTYLGKFQDEAISWGASAPWDVAVADDGYVYVCDRSMMFAYCFTPDGQFVSQSPTQTNHRAIFARKTPDGKTHIYHSGGTVIKKMTVNADHVTWQTTPFGGNTLFAASGASNCGMWANADNTTVYVASNGGDYNGVSKWNLVSGAWVQDGAFAVGPPTPAAGQQGTTDVTFVGGAVPSLWINRQVSSTYFPVRKSDPATNAMISEFGSPLNWGLMISNDGVGNIAANWGHSTWTWANHYWALFAEAGTYTCSTKRTTAFQLTATPSPVVVPGSAVWTPDNTIAADDYDTASVSFKIMDVNGWADIMSCTVDLRPIGYSGTAPCSLSQDVSDATGKTAIATLSGIKAKVGTRCTTGFGQPVHFLTATPVDAAMGSNADPEELKLQVTGDPYFDANIRHTRVSTWFISGAQIKAVGGGIPGATDPRAQGPFTYYSALSDVGGYANIELSAGSYAVSASKVGFGSTAPINITAPYTGFTVELYLRPLTIAEARATPNGTKVNVEGVCYAQPKGLAPTAADGLETRTDTTYKRGQWYVCDPNSAGNGMLFMVTAPSDTFPFQWDDVDGQDFLGNSTYFGKRPAVGETIMITGLLDIPGGHERRVLIQNTDIETGLANFNILPTYSNLGNLGGLPAAPVNLAITDFMHGVTQSFHEAWGKFAKTENAIVLGYTADGTETGMTPVDAVPYLTVADLAGHTAQIAIDKPATLGNPAIPSIGSVYTFTGAAGRRERYGSGCIRVRGASDMVETAAAQAVLKVNLVDQAAGAVTGAQWRRVGQTTWLNSGALELLAAGSYDIEFKPVTNYVTPANANVSVTVSAVTTVTGTYTKYGTLKVTLLPAAAVTAGAQWRRVGQTTWLNSAASESLPPGNYTVEFKPISGFTAPAPLAVTIVAATANNQTATYSDSLPAPDGMAVIRTKNDGDPINVHGIVSAKIGAAIWIQAPDRSVGIRVEGTSSAVEVGDDAQVVGALDLQDGEMVIVPTAIAELVNGTTAPAALDMRSREIGGKASGTTPGVSTGRGALNVGLKIHFLGMVTSAAANSYYLWDGANRSDMPVSDGAGTGVLVEAAPPADVAPWTDWVDVTGVVGAKDLGGGVIAPTIVPISAAKVTSFDTIAAPSGTALTAGWNLLGLPAAPAAVSDGDEWTPKAWEPYMVLSPTQDPFDIDGRMYRWENCSGSLYNWDYWTEVGSHGPFGGALLGDGYWMQLSDPWAVSYSGKASTLDQWIGVCNTGWMIIGHPKPHNTYMADLIVHDGGAVYSMTDAVLTNNWIDCVGYWWDNQVQSLIDVGIPDCWGSTDTLLPWHGYWLQAYEKDLALIVPEAPVAP